MTCLHCGADAAALQAEVARLRARVAELEQTGEALAADARQAYDQRREVGREAQRLRVRAREADARGFCRDKACKLCGGKPAPTCGCALCSAKGGDR